MNLLRLKIPPYFFHVLFIKYAELFYALSFLCKNDPMSRKLKYENHAKIPAKSQSKGR